MKTPHGYDILAYRRVWPEIAVVLAERDPVRHLHPYVIWNMGTTSGQCVHGAYCSTLAEAEERFQARISNLLVSMTPTN